jgi:hypothetical protein
MNMARFCNQPLFAVLIPLLLCSSAFPDELQTPTASIPDSYFGLHIHHLDNPVPTPWPSMPVPAWRLWDAGVNWPDLQPNKEQWQFGRLDRYIAMAQQHGTSILLPLGGSPTWASARPQVGSHYSPGFTAEPANLDDWRTFVRTVVTRYKGRIQAYEIWNEPNLKDFWSGTTDQMLTLTKEASQIIHSVDPGAIVVSPSATAEWGIPWLAEFLKKGGGQYVDVIGFHLYLDPPTKSPEEIVPFIQHVRRTISENNLGNMPLWNTESGVIGPPRFDSDDAAGGFLARVYILAWAAGVQRFYWYAWDNQGMALKTYDEANHTVAPAGYAYKVMEQWLVGAQMAGCTESVDHTWTCQLSRSGTKEWIVWNSQGSQKFDVPAAWHVGRVTPLLHEQHALNGSSVDISPAPTLLTGRS